MKSKLITYYHRFCRWQEAGPHYLNRHEGCMQHCHNCGTEFADNFCPRCAQKVPSVQGQIGLLYIIYLDS